MTQVSGDIAAIAAGLSEAQRRALTGAYCLDDLGYMTRHKTGRSATVLHASGLTQLGWSPSALTPLGLAVRAYLQGKSHD